MRSPPIGLIALLVLFAGCRDGPTAITAPDDTAASLERQAMASRAALLAVQEILGDSFVRELVEGLGVHGRAFQNAAQDMTAVYVREDLRELSETLRFTAPRSTVGVADDEVLRAALELILDDAADVAASHFEYETSPPGRSVGRR